MYDFLRSTRDQATVVLERERPFFSPGALSMYTLALAAEAPVIVARLLLALLVTYAVLLIERNPEGSPTWALVALIPTAWSMLALFNPAGGAWWWRTRAGGREPSKREQHAYQDAIELLQSNTARPLPLPKHWFVIDSPHPDAAVCGDTLMISHGLLETDHLPAVLAHELGHLGSPDAPIDRRDQPPDRVLHPVPRKRRNRTPTTPNGAAALPAIHPAPVDGRVRPRTGDHTGPVRVRTVPIHHVPVRERRTRAMAHRTDLGALLARTRVPGRPVRRRARAGGRARGLPRDPRPDPRQPDPVPMAHRTHPPTHGAEARPAQNRNR